MMPAVIGLLAMLIIAGLVVMGILAEHLGYQDDEPDEDDDDDEDDDNDDGPYDPTLDPPECLMSVDTGPGYWTY